MTMVADQLDLTSIAIGGRSLDARFRAFHDEHPDVYEALVRLARQAKSAGRKRIGMKLLAEVVRWERITSGKDDEGWKLNNSYVSRYARLIAEREPDLASLFEMRELRS